MAEMPELLNVKTEDSFSDSEVIRSVLDGAVNNFELLIQRHKGKVGRIVASRVRAEDVEDIAQQTFVRAFKALGSFGGKAPFENWLSKLAVHCCHDYWRVKQRENARFVRPGEEADYQDWFDKVSAVVNDSDLAEAAKLEETQLALERAMECLDADERWLLESHYYEGMPLREAAATLEWSLVKTKVKAMRARMKLRKAIDRLIKEWSK
jgi:RNA polymerase sigma-70 factor (ECF subfamily)